MEIRKITTEQKALLDKPLPPEAVQPNAGRSFLSSIKAIYVTERLNDVFGVGAWRIATDEVEKSGKMVVVKVRFTIPEYGIEYECFGGNDNTDIGDAYKGATTDALTKIGSWLGIGADVFKGKQTAATAAAGSRPAAAPVADPIASAQPMPKRDPSEIRVYDSRREEQKIGNVLNLSNDVLSDSLLKWAYNRLGADGTAEQAVELLAKCYRPDEATRARFYSLYNSYIVARKNS